MKEIPEDDLKALKTSDRIKDTFKLIRSLNFNATAGRHSYQV